MKIKITKLENKLLNDIMLGENDGVCVGIGRASCRERV